jgi:glycosyltransferase involved in cell wall biosynthesis
MPPESPLVSVLVTAYNREAFIRDALESVLRSSFQDFEVIVSDDASTDDTVGIARELAARDPRIRVFVNDSNLGDYRNRNQAASYARGELLKYVDSDDIIYPHGLEVMVGCMQTFPGAGLGLSAHGDPSRPYPVMLTPAETYRENFEGRDILSRAPGSAIVRRVAFEAAGGFSGRPQVGDHELWLKLARTYPVVKMPADLVWDRQHVAQERRQDSDIEKVAMHAAVARDALRHPECPLAPNEREAALYQLERNIARLYWQLVPRGRGIITAEELRRKASLSPGTVGRVALDAIVSALGGRRST